MNFLNSFCFSCWDKDPDRRPSMEQVVKEMSHLFQFFPDEVDSLKYPNQSGPLDVESELDSLKTL